MALLRVYCLLKSYQEFGIDIVGEDNKAIIHHKVAVRVVCVFNEQDAQVAARAEQHQQHLQQQQFLRQQDAPGAPSPLTTVTAGLVVLADLRISHLLQPSEELSSLSGDWVGREVCDHPARRVPM